MKTTFLIWALIHSTLASAVIYDDTEIQALYSNHKNHQNSASLISDYFTAKNPDRVIDELLLKANITPLQREFHLYNLLTEISQQPPQDFFQNFVNRMKHYPTIALRAAHEGHLPVAVFNLNSKAHGTENIWTTYRTEQHFNQLFENNLPQATKEISEILKQNIKLRQPQWLGIKDSIGAMCSQSLQRLATFLLHSKDANGALDSLISYVGFVADRSDLIEKALASELVKVREMTLRQILVHWPPSTAKSLLMTKAQTGKDRKFSTSLLSQFSNDSRVERFLTEQLNDPVTAASAAFALSQSNSMTLPTALKQRFMTSDDSREKNHLLLALKLNPTQAAEVALEELTTQLEKDTAAAKWLQTFEGKSAGGKP
ncbi:hypothetical protein OS175_09160 [Marinicella sp. S1101]|uniref:hypothetical protein n=1 Tax=Marinicella marina TaxID=2996016 RepID=UPI002260AC8F|nr:hypothetical protein [Marinicella marina]MCX7554045.1 hypothetical protein [Marinicella marina]MDJ1140537.1 hypothetical protein [Marinicella marina]